MITIQNIKKTKRKTLCFAYSWFARICRDDANPDPGSEVSFTQAFENAKPLSLVEAKKCLLRITAFGLNIKWRILGI